MDMITDLGFEHGGLALLTPAQMGGAVAVAVGARWTRRMRCPACSKDSRRKRITSRLKRSSNLPSIRGPAGTRTRP